MVTIGDVATRAGVGQGTVSRVLNHSPLVSDKTRSKVLAVMRELEYRPSPLARGLAGGKVSTIGAVVPFFTHPSAVERLRGIVAPLGGSPFDLVLCNVETPAQRDEHFRSLVRRHRAAGVLAVSLTPTDTEVDAFAAAGVPAVLVDARHARLASVVTDDEEGGRIATRHLLALGHRRIAFVGDVADNAYGFTSSALRLNGLRQELGRAGVELTPDYVKVGNHGRYIAHRLTEELLALSVRPTAIFASSDTQALGVLEAARAVGLRIPEDLSVLGFDDIEVAVYVGLTTVRQPLFESGRRGAELLLQALEGTDAPDPTEHRLPLELVVRSTTGPPPSTTLPITTHKGDS